MIQKVILGDCLEKMKEIQDETIDMILCDLPYGVTARNKWDEIIPLDNLWLEYKRIIKTNGAIVLTAIQPFTSQLVMSNIDMFKYEWIWEKEAGTGFLNAKKCPLKSHENILVFYKKQCQYNPQMDVGKPYKCRKGGLTDNYNVDSKSDIITENNGFRYPKTVLKYSRDKNKLHPTQKPVSLFEYLIKTYTNEGDIVLDNCAGSGTTGVAAKNLNRQFILIEKEEKYYNICLERLGMKNVDSIDINVEKQLI